MVDVETQIGRLADHRAEQVEPWRPGPSALSAAEPRPGPWWSRRMIAGAAGLAAAAAIIGMILIPDDDSGSRVTTTVPSTIDAPAATSTTVVPPTVTVTLPLPLVPEATISPASGAPSTVFTGRTTADPLVRGTEAQTMDLWLVRVDGALGPASAAALAGSVVVEPSGAVTFAGEVPQTLATSRTGEFRAGTVVAMLPGEYALAIAPSLGDELRDPWGLARIRFTVTEIGTGLPAPRTGDAAPAEGSTVLEGDSLAGIPIGTGANETIARLIDRFGAPSSDTGWENACLTERRVQWGGLMAWFVAEDAHDASAATDGIFGWYLYEHSEGSTAGLATPSGVQLGASIADLRGREPTTEWMGGYDSAVLDHWWTESGTVGHLSTDITGRDPVVISIGAGGGAIAGPFTVC